jgi:hypothetical protein
MAVCDVGEVHEGLESERVAPDLDHRPLRTTDAVNPVWRDAQEVLKLYRRG